MFLTGSIRRKLVIGLGLVCLMLFLLGIAGIAGLMSYGAIIDELEYSLDQAPRRKDLLDAVARLFDSLIGDRTTPTFTLTDVHNNEETAAASHELPLKFNATSWAVQMEQVRLELKEFRRRVDRLPPSLDVRQVLRGSQLDRIQELLKLLERRRAILNGTKGDEDILQAMIRDVSRIQTIIEQIPNAERGTDFALRQAPTVFKYRLWQISGCMLVIPILLGILVRCGHFWVFVPIRKLHEAASRVANGDYAFRLKLRGRDEMVDLANVFNRMIERFQNDKDKLDSEVEERSRQLLRNERLAGIGFLATGIAHEINNPLSAITMAAESLMDRLKDAGDKFGTTAADHELLQTYLEMIQRQSHRCQQITTRVLDFSRNSAAPRKRHDLTRIVSEVLDMVGHMSRFDHHTIEFDRKRSHYVEVNAPEIQQVIINLVANGLEAMDKAGTMKIGITDSFDEVVLTVEDSGCGMTPHVLANLYEPFFTEKLPGKKGTGLGLSITNRIIAEHNGRIEASSEGPGKGSTFRVHLPRIAAAISRAA